MGRGEEASGGREEHRHGPDASKRSSAHCILDGGLNVAREFILTQTSADLEETGGKAVDVNPKGDPSGAVTRHFATSVQIYELIPRAART